MSGVLDLIGEAPEPEEPRRRSQADRLAELALERYELGVTPTGDAFGVSRSGVRIARMLRGSAQSLRAELARAYFERYSRVPSSTALADALVTLAGFAAMGEPTTVYLRHAAVDGCLWIDLGDTSGAAVCVSADGWTLEECAPVTFRRSELTGVLPIPQRGEIAELRAFLNVGEESWRLIVGWLVSACFPAVPRPMLVLTGEQGTAKSTTGRFLVSVLDPSPAPLRTAPRDVGEWVTVADGSCVVGLDNLSGLPGWLSDAICRAVTGDGLPRRRLYSDAELVVSSFRKTILLTSIDLGALSADLIDRSLFCELERIGPERRKLESELAEAFADGHPRIFGALLDLVSATMRELPAARLDSYPRMADHARVLHALDLAVGGDHLAAFEDASERAMLDALDGSPVAEAVVVLMAGRSSWEGSASDLLERITPSDAPKRWPATPHHLSGQLRRLAPVLRARGVEVVFGRSHTGRTIELRVTHDAGDACSQLLFENKERDRAFSDKGICAGSVTSVTSVTDELVPFDDAEGGDDDA